MTVRRRSNWHLARLFVPWLRPHGGALAAAGVLMLLTTALFQVGPLLVRRLIDVDVARRDMPGLYWTVACYAVTQAVYLYANYRQRLLLEAVGLGVVTAIKKALSDRVLQLSLSFFDRTPPGQLISRVESDTESLRQMFTFTALNVSGDSLRLLVGIAVMMYVRLDLSLIVLAVLLILITLSILFDRVVRPFVHRGRESAAGISAFIQERLHAVPLIQAFGQEESTALTMDEQNRRKCRADGGVYLWWNAYFNLLMLIEVLGVCGTLAYGGSLVLRGALSVGTLLMFMEYLRRFFEPVYRLSEQINVLARAFACGERVFDLLEEQPAVRDAAVCQNWSGLTSGIEFRDVTFGYRDEPVLRNLSFYLPRGQHWALVGPTGGGKTSIVSLLLRFYDAQQGAVLVDGVDVRQMRQADLRAGCALVLQDIVIFPGTVHDNIALHDADKSRADVESAAQLAAADGFVRLLDQGYETPLLDGGSNLSTGQRQLLSFARALARDPDILILDEATASIDPATEREVQDALRRLLQGRTALIVAHRLSTVRDADRILVIEGGRIVEQGTHQHLMSLGGAYHRLYALQGEEVFA